MGDEVFSSSLQLEGWLQPCVVTLYIQLTRSSFYDGDSTILAAYGSRHKITIMIKQYAKTVLKIAKTFPLPIHVHPSRKNLFASHSQSLWVI